MDNFTTGDNQDKKAPDEPAMVDEKPDKAPAKNENDMNALDYEIDKDENADDAEANITVMHATLLSQKSSHASKSVDEAEKSNKKDSVAKKLDKRRRSRSPDKYRKKRGHSDSRSLSRSRSRDRRRRNNNNRRDIERRRPYHSPYRRRDSYRSNHGRRKSRSISYDRRRQRQRSR